MERGTGHHRVVGEVAGVDLGEDGHGALLADGLRV